MRSWQIMHPIHAEVVFALRNSNNDPWMFPLIHGKRTKVTVLAPPFQNMRQSLDCNGSTPKTYGAWALDHERVLRILPDLVNSQRFHSRSVSCSIRTHTQHNLQWKWFDFWELKMGLAVHNIIRWVNQFQNAFSSREFMVLSKNRGELFQQFQHGYQAITLECWVEEWYVGLQYWQCCIFDGGWFAIVEHEWIVSSVIVYVVPLARNCNKTAKRKLQPNQWPNTPKAVSR